MDLEGLESKFIEVYDQTLPEEIKNCKTVDQVYDLMFDILKKRYEDKVNELGSEQFSRIEKYIMLEVLDQKWRQNLKDLTELREGINLQSYGQKNPINEYKISSADVYNDMIDGINRETTAFLLRLKFTQDQEQDEENELSRREKLENN